MTKPEDIEGTARTGPTPRRCAIYARYSCELSRPSSIEDQVYTCRRDCARHDGWVVVEEWVVADREVSGRSLAGRDAMDALKKAAKRKPRPFDCVLIDDTSRFGRNLGDVIKLAEFFEYYGVFLHFVSPPLDSSDPNFDQLLIFKGMMDQQHSVGLADKVRRGHHGRVRKGYNAGSAPYGYRNVPEPDPNGKGDGLIGVQLQIIEEQAKVVRRIFEMYVNGSSLDGIARVLRSEGVTAPKPPRKNSARGWSGEGITEILRNKKYIGVCEWGRTTSVLDPESGRFVARATPQEEWVYGKNPNWRIISDDLWERAQKERELRRHFGAARLGGLSRTSRSREYLFSGLIFCCLCGRSISITDGSGDDGRYGCAAHRYKGACANGLTIRRRKLQDQVLRWLTRELLQGVRLDEAITSFQNRVQERVAELRELAHKNAVNAPELRKELAEKKQEAWNLTDFIAGSGRQSSPTVQARLVAAETRIKEIEALLVRAKEPAPITTFSAEELKDHLVSKLVDLEAVLTSTPEAGRQVIRKFTSGESHWPPTKSKASPQVFRVTVEFELGGGGNSGGVAARKRWMHPCSNTALARSRLRDWRSIRVVFDESLCLPRTLRRTAARPRFRSRLVKALYRNPPVTVQVHRTKNQCSPRLSELSLVRARALLCRTVL